MRPANLTNLAMRLFSRASVISGAFILSIALAAEAFARVGGGGSYSGGGGHGGSGGDGGGGGALIWLIFQLFRMLVYLTIEYPAVGIPLDILVAAGVAYYRSQLTNKVADTITT